MRHQEEEEKKEGEGEDRLECDRCSEERHRDKEKGEGAEV